MYQYTVTNQASVTNCHNTFCNMSRHLILAYYICGFDVLIKSFYEEMISTCRAMMCSLKCSYSEAFVTLYTLSRCSVTWARLFVFKENRISPCQTPITMSAFMYNNLQGRKFSFNTIVAEYVNCFQMPLLSLTAVPWKQEPIVIRTVMEALKILSGSTLRL